MNKKKILTFIGSCLLMTAMFCGCTSTDNQASASDAAESVESVVDEKDASSDTAESEVAESSAEESETEGNTDPAEDSATESTDAAIVTPISAITSADEALNNGDYSIAFSEDPFTMDENKTLLTMDVYEYDRYSKDSIDNLKTGDQIKYCGETVLVESVEATDFGYIAINGGEENDGFNLTEENGIYHTVNVSAFPDYYAVGTITIALSDNLVFEDHNDTDKEPDGVLYQGADAIASLQSTDIPFSPSSTIVTVENNEIVKILRLWTP